MKKILFFLLSLIIAATVPVSANAQERIGSYTYCGIEKPVGFNQEKQQVFIEAHDTGLGQLIYLKGEESIEGFRKSLIDMKEEYIAMKTSSNKVGKTKMSSSFDEFIVSWSSPSNKNTTLGGICEGIHPIFQVTRNKKNNSLDSFAVIDERVKDISEGNGYAVLFICFQNEDEIQSLIDVLSLCLERLSTPSSSQNATRENPQKTTTENSQNANENVLKNSIIGTDWLPSDASVFDYSTFTNGIAYAGARPRPRTFHIKGIISPTAVEKYNILCLETMYGGGNSGSKYIIIPNERVCNIWISALTGMKELLLKNDKIAKENNVIADVKKDVSDRFSFDGVYGTLNSTRPSDYDPIVNEYNDEYRIKYGYQDVSQNKIGVFYLYEEGKSSMELRIANYYTRTYGTIWTFNNVEDFDEIINALNWSSFMQSINAQAQEIKQKQDLEARKQREQALFD